MHVGIFTRPEQSAEVKAAMRSLRAVHIKSTGSTIADKWIHGDEERLLESLAILTHILVIARGKDAFSDWLTFLYGYALGREIPFIVACDESIPRGLGHATRVVLEEVDNFMLAERSKWEQIHRVRIARTRLAGRENDSNAFYESATAGDARSIEDFLVAGQTSNARSSEGIPVLIGAVRSQCVECVQKLIAAGADPNATAGRDGTNALSEAASRGLATVAGVLLAHNADPNQATSNGQTALMLAASQGHLEVVERLMSAGADSEVKDSLGMDAAGYARLFDKGSILEALGGEEAS